MVARRSCLETSVNNMSMSKTHRHLRWIIQKHRFRIWLFKSGNGLLRIYRSWSNILSGFTKSSLHYIWILRIYVSAVFLYVHFGGLGGKGSLKSTSGKRLSRLGVCTQMILSGFQPTFSLRIQFRLIFRFFMISSTSSNNLEFSQTNAT